MMKKLCHVHLTLILLLVFLNLGALYVHLGLAFGCHKAEREALLKFKQSFAPGLYNPLSFWKGMNCCHWFGVNCNNVTGYVNRLDLSCIPSQEFDVLCAPDQQLLANKLDPSLVELKYLEYLDLSGIDFQQSQISEFIGLLNHLRYLNLSNAGFGGIVPYQLGNLTSLQTLDLSTVGYDGIDLPSDPHWVSGLVNLRYLDISYRRISRPRDLMQVINRFPSLIHLGLASCVVERIPLSFIISSNSTWLSKIQHLDLSDNYFTGQLPLFIANMTSLVYLDLSTTASSEIRTLSGSIPLWFRTMRKLEHIGLSGHCFSHIEGGSVMGIVGNPCKIKLFDLSFNYFLQGEIGGSFDNFSNCVTYDLETLSLSSTLIKGTLPPWLWDLEKLTLLDIGSNNISGQISTSIGRLSNLNTLDMSYNNLHGPIPSSIIGLSSLESLRLSNNYLDGNIPETLGQLMALNEIDLSSNLLVGVISDSHFMSLLSLKYLDLRSNLLELKFSSNWAPPFQLIELSMGNCSVTAEFPLWLESQTQLGRLDLSNAGISGKLPHWFQNISLNLYDLNLSNNHITGAIPNMSYRLQNLDLSSNLFAESLPPSLCQLRILLKIDLSKNKISGPIPDCWKADSPYDGYLVIINLSSNKLYGTIPKTFGLLPQLELLNLNKNLLEGVIPHTFNSSSTLMILDLGENKLSGGIPSFSSKTHPYLQYLRLRSNRFMGVIPRELCSCPLQLLDLASNTLTGHIPRCFALFRNMIIQSNVSISIDAGSITEVLKGHVVEYTNSILPFVVNLDLSCNNLVGSIPDGITNLSGLIGLNLSYNHLNGSIPQKIGNIISLESLDLSNNDLSGTIPSSMSALTFLSHLNLSNNNLHGEIPTGPQLQSLSDPPISIYGGNPGLCGESLPKKCKASHGHQQQEPEKDKTKKEDNSENLLFYTVIFLGFGTGFWGIVGSLILRRWFRFALFQLVDDITDYLYVRVAVRINRLRI